MKRFVILLKKELRELLTPQMIVPIIITVLLFLVIGNVLGKETEKALAKRTVVVLDLDNTRSSNSVVSFIRKSGFKVALYKDQDIDTVIEESKRKKLALVLVIPTGFEKGLDKLDPQLVQTYVIFESFSMLNTQDAGILKGIIASINDSLSNQLLATVGKGLDPQKIKNPISVQEHVIVGNKKAEVSADQVTGFIMSQTMFIPIILLIVILLSSQMIATAIASEKENKTLETLLSMPVSRNVIVIAKMLAAALVALTTAIVYVFSMGYYMKGVGITGIEGVNFGVPGSTDAVKVLGLVLSPADYLLLGISLFFGILCALAISIILGAFAQEVKSVQALTTPLMILVFIPYILSMFLDINSISPTLRYLVLANPFSHPFLAAPNLFLGNLPLIFWGIAYQAAVFVVFVYIAGRIFSSDKILTMKLTLKIKKDRL